MSRAGARDHSSTDASQHAQTPGATLNNAINTLDSPNRPNQTIQHAASAHAIQSKAMLPPMT